jgi:hypothetical protein
MYSKDEIKELHLKFWQNFKIYCETQPVLNFKKKRWILNETQIRGVAMRFELDRESAKVILELQHNAPVITRISDLPDSLKPKTSIFQKCRNHLR